MILQQNMIVAVKSHLRSGFRSARENILRAANTSDADNSSSAGVAKVARFASDAAGRRSIVAVASPFFSLPKMRGLTTNRDTPPPPLAHRRTPGRANLRRITDTISSKRRKPSGVLATAQPPLLFFATERISQPRFKTATFPMI